MKEELSEILPGAQEEYCSRMQGDRGGETLLSARHCLKSPLLPEE
jgi:hypothetical protein